MLQNLIQFVTEQLQTNSFFSGGAILMFIGGLLASLRTYPAKLYHWMRRRFIVEIDIPDRDEAFTWINDWLAQHRYSKKRARLLTVSTKRVGDRDDCQPQIIFAPAPGYHFLFFKRRLMLLHRHRKDSADGKTDALIDAFKETFNIKIVTRNRDLARQLLEEAREVTVPKNDNQVRVYTARWGWWTCDIKRPPRSLDSVILADGILENLRDDVQRFLDDRKWYTKCGIPYRRGYLLHGPPGNGKSSLVLALAAYFRLDIAILNLSDKALNDDELSRLFARLPEHCLVLVEDVDCAFVDRSTAPTPTPGVPQATLSFSGLLNAIDGVVASEGRALFMTTNHPELLDPALIRPGRIDRQIRIDNAEDDQIIRQFERFYPESTFGRDFAGKVPRPISMASLQGHLIKYRGSPDEALQHLNELK